MRIRSGMSAKLVIFLLVLVGLSVVVVRRVYPFNECGKPGASTCPTAAHEAAAGTQVARTDFCPNAGYLCKDGLQSSFILRWSLFKGVLPFRVPLPEGHPDNVAHEMRSAAIAGILEWTGHPFRIEIDSGSFPTRRWDVSVVWTESLAGIGSNVGGVTHIETTSPNAADFSVRNIAVNTRPLQDGESASAAYITTVAAHEMGHALGLGHSDEPTDVMYPSAAEGTQVSERDLIAVDWLYWLPAGATVR